MSWVDSERQAVKKKKYIYIILLKYSQTCFTFFSANLAITFKVIFV